MIGVNSAIIIREPEDQPARILLLSHYSNGLWGEVVHSYHWSWLATPWDIQGGTDLNDPIHIPGEGTWMNDIDGYGTYIIDGTERWDVLAASNDGQTYRCVCRKSPKTS